MYKKTVSVLLLTVLLLTACASSFPDFPVDDETIAVLDNETTVAAPDDTTVPEQDETTDPEQNTKPPSNESVVTQAKPAQTEVISSPLISSSPDTEDPADIDILNPIPYKAYPYANHNFSPSTDLGYYNYYGKLKNNAYKNVEEAELPPYTVTINGIEFVGNHIKTQIYNMNGKIGSLKRTYQIPDIGSFIIDAETDELLFFRIDYNREGSTLPTISEYDAFSIAKAFIELQTQFFDRFDTSHFRYSITFEERYGFSSYYQIEYQRYINEIPTAEKFRAYVNVYGDLYFYEHVQNCSEMEAMVSYIDFDLAKLCADEKMYEIIQRYTNLKKENMGEPEILAIRLSLNGGFFLHYTYPISDPKSNAIGYQEIVVCVLNPDFQH